VTENKPENSESPILNVEGDLVALGPLRRELLPLYTRWINDPAAARTLGAFLPVTLEGETKWYDEWATLEKIVPFTIYARPELKPIGTASLFDVDHRNRAAVFGIFVGDPEYRGRGYGTETTRLVLDYAFTAVGLHNVMLTVFDLNPAGIRAYEKAGFKEFGRRKESQRIGGELRDEVFMQCLSTEFESPVLARIFAPDSP
jgi:RimJ/RimL family protein N-acetyltransferase